MTPRSRHYVLVSATMLVIFLLVGCRSEPEDPLDAFASTAVVERSTISEVVQMAGQIVSLQSRQLSMGTIGGRVMEVLVSPGQEVLEGQALLRLDTAQLERALREAEADLTVAEATLAEAQRTASEAEIGRAEGELAGAEYLLAEAELSLTLAEKAGLTPLEEEVADARRDLEVARDQLRMQEIGAGKSQIRELEYDQRFYQRTLRDTSPESEGYAEVAKTLAKIEDDLSKARSARESTLQAARDAITRKERELGLAEARLARAKSGEEDPTISARLAYQEALESYESARVKLEELLAGMDTAAVSAARTVHEAALAKVESARADLEASTLRAPFDGVIFAVYAQPGDEIQPAFEVIFLADPDDLRVRAQASEMDIPKLVVGQDVRITFDAYPGQLFSGQVLTLPARGQGQGGITFYEIEASLDHGGSDVRIGMMANLRVLVGEQRDVLTIPAAAIVYGENNETYVKARSDDGQAEEVAVEVGLNDGILAEVVSGLIEGQRVLVPLVPPTEQFQYGY